MTLWLYIALVLVWALYAATIMHVSFDTARTLLVLSWVLLILASIVDSIWP